MHTAEEGEACLQSQGWTVKKLELIFGGANREHGGQRSAMSRWSSGTKPEEESWISCRTQGSSQLMDSIRRQASIRNWESEDHLSIAPCGLGARRIANEHLKERCPPAAECAPSALTRAFNSASDTER